MDEILSNLISDAQIVARFPGSSPRTVRARARKLGIGRRFSRTLYFTESEILGLMQEVSKCSNQPNGKARQTSTRAGHTSESQLTKAYELATGGKPKDSSQSSKAKFSKRTCAVVPLPSKDSLAPR